jgi:hypothetical protein
VSAYQVSTVSTAMIAATPAHRRVKILNKGPNPINVEIGSAATTTGGYEIAATTGTADFVLPAGQALNVIAATANQVSPSDTRFLLTPST